MSSLTHGISNLFSSLFEILAGIFDTLFSAVQSVFGLAGDLVSSIFDLMSGVVGFVLGMLCSSPSYLGLLLPSVSHEDKSAVYTSNDYECEILRLI